MNDNTSMTVLLIDDKSENIFALEQLLEKADRVFLRATSGREGLRIALNQDVDLIILDVQMPGMDGFEVAQILKSSKRTQDIPIIFASAEKKERHSVIQGFEEGAVDYLAKPLDPELTKAKVSVLLKIQYQKRELIAKNIALLDAEKQINQLNAHLNKNLERLEQVNKELESFSYSVSHDLRAPLRALIGYSKILEEDYIENISAEAKRALSIIQENSSRMNRMIDDLLDFSRLGRREIRTTPIDMAMLVHDVIAGLAETHPHNASITVSEILPASADKSLLTHVWENLISNAIKYSGKHSSPQVEIGSHRQGNEIVYSVKDNGAGFDEKYAENLFGVFQRLHKTSEFPGTGVGLAIVHRIVSRHGGRVWAAAKVNEGALFQFTLPHSETA